VDGVLAPRLRVALSRRVLRVADDERLVAEVRAGSRSAFEVIYDRHHAGILAFCRHMLGSREEAEDVVQHTFAAAYEALLADDREIALKAWLYAIARNRCYSVLRGRREHVELEDDGGTSPTTTAGLSVEVERREDLRVLLDDLQRLPADQRAALVLAELGAHSHEEIAVILGVPTTKIKALVFQAREALMSRRLAREADCGPIREQLAVLRGGARRRGDLRNHVAQCDGCRAFEAEVRRQRAGMAVLLPVAPTFALKQSTLAAAFAGGGGGAAAAGGAAAGGGAVSGAAAGSATAGTMAAGGVAAGGAAGGGTVAGGAAAATGGSGLISGGGVLLGAKAIAAKTAIALAVTGSVAGGGYATVKELSKPPAPPAREVPARFEQPQKLGFKPPAVAPLGTAGHEPCPKDRAGGCTPQASHDLLPAARTTGDPNATGTPYSTADDRDGDGVPDSTDNCARVPGTDDGCPAAGPAAAGQAPSEPAAPKPGDRDGDGIPNRRDGDQDGDGFLNTQDKCATVYGTVEGCPPPASGAKPAPGGRASGDRDGDGVPNAKDSCPTKPGTAGGCPPQGSTTPAPAGHASGDRDGDGVPNREDNCPNDPGPLGGCPQPPPNAPVPAGPVPGDRDGDGIANSADADRDGDGVLNRDDNCPNKRGSVGGCPPQVPIEPLPAGPVDGDRDGDGIPDNADVDRDGDGFRNVQDTCPNRFGTDAGCPAPAPAPAPPSAPATTTTEPPPADPSPGGP
jgi:RNA polymerase sigma factor (sigma-70 family)